MSWWTIITALESVITKPLELITDWAREPLRKWEFERQIKQKECESELRMKEEVHKSNLHIKRETEIVRILQEIEELKKDKQFERMKATSEAILKYQKELSNINREAISAIGNMQIELREKAQNLIHDKVVRYKEFQKIATDEAMVDFKRIEDNFFDNDRAKDILYRAVDQRLANVIKAADNFLLELSKDISSINQSICMLSDSGQKFIQNHLGQYKVIEFSDNDVKRLE